MDNLPVRAALFSYCGRQKNGQRFHVAREGTQEAGTFCEKEPNKTTFQALFMWLVQK